MFTRRDAIVAIAAVGAGSAYALWPRDPSEETAALPEILDLSVNAQETTAAVEVQEYTLGDADAPIKMVEYASFTCPHCAAFHNDTFKQLKAEYIDTGKVHFTYREVYFDRYGLWAGMVARCGDGGKYFGVVDLLYQSQREWSRAGEAADVAGALRKLGLQSGFTPDEVDACMQDSATAKALVGRFEENASRDNVRSTPSFLINGEMHAGNLPLAEIKDLLDANL